MTEVFNLAAMWPIALALSWLGFLIVTMALTVDKNRGWVSAFGMLIFYLVMPLPALVYACFVPGKP
jgi:hypothetical protein